MINTNLSPVNPDTVCQLKLVDGSLMPQAAMGTFHSDNPDLMKGMKDIVVEAIRLGYRHIDCATAYQNEEIVGQAIEKSIKIGLVKREDLFILSKLWNKNMKPDEVIPALKKTLTDLRVDYLDMYVVHWPWSNFHEPGSSGDALNDHAVPYIHEDFMEVWDKMTELKRLGLVKNIGTSNQTKKTIDLLLRDTDDFNRPTYNQMELHPLFQQKEFIQFLIKNKIVPSGYMSLGSPRRPGRDRFPEHQSDMHHHIIQSISAQTGLTPPQVCLAWAHQRENNQVGYVSMAERSDWIKSNLLGATQNVLSNEQFQLIDGNNTEENPGINTNNRLIWGQVFLWPEAKYLGHPRYVLWDDHQIFETKSDYDEFRKAFKDFYKVWKSTAYNLDFT